MRSARSKTVLLDELDRHRLFVDPQHARFFARRGADSAGKFREVVRLEQHLQGILPAVLVNQVIPFRDDVAQWTTVVAERNAAVHAPRALLAKLVVAEVEIDLVPVQHAQLNRPALGHLAGNLFETGGFTHGFRYILSMLKPAS
jgi:hypothetical protein